MQIIYQGQPVVDVTNDPSGLVYNQNPVNAQPVATSVPTPTVPVVSPDGQAATIGQPTDSPDQPNDGWFDKDDIKAVVKLGVVFGIAGVIGWILTSAVKKTVQG